MAYTVKIDGIESLDNLLKNLGNEAAKVAPQGLYDGAGVMADEINKTAESIRAERFHYAVFVQRKPSEEEKAAVLSAKAGIARFGHDGLDVNTSVGYANSGYAEINGRRKPIPQIANAINSGTSFMQAQPFFRRAVNSGRRKAEEAIAKSIEEKLEKMINESGGR